MNTRSIIVQKQESIATLILNRPESQNAFNFQLASELTDVCQQIYADKKIRAVIVTAQGKEAFSIGWDVAEAEKPDGKAETVRRPSVASPVSTLPQPVIAAINGDALGQGLELALACDLRICGSHARFAMPQVSVGEIPRDGGTQRLSRLVGKGKALELILTGERIDAQEALRIGLVQRVVPKGQAVEEAKKLLKKIISKGPVAIKMAKKAINEGLAMSLRGGQDLEAQCQSLCFATEDKDEGAKAFIEKRPPNFKGK